MAAAMKDDLTQGYLWLSQPGTYQQIIMLAEYRDAMDVDYTIAAMEAHEREAAEAADAMVSSTSSSTSIMDGSGGRNDIEAHHEYEDGLISVPSKLLILIGFSCMGFLASSMSAAICKHFGALTMSITSTARKATTLFLSFALFNNVCTTEHIVGIIIFVGALIIKSCHKSKKHNKHNDNNVIQSNVGKQKQVSNPDDSDDDETQPFVLGRLDSLHSGMSSDLSSVGSNLTAQQEQPIIMNNSNVTKNENQYYSYNDNDDDEEDDEYDFKNNIIILPIPTTRATTNNNNSNNNSNTTPTKTISYNNKSA